MYILYSVQSITQRYRVRHSRTSYGITVLFSNKPSRCLSRRSQLNSACRNTAIIIRYNYYDDHTFILNEWRVVLTTIITLDLYNVTFSNFITCIYKYTISYTLLSVVFIMSNIFSCFLVVSTNLDYCNA